jgi:hypothetical protein
MKLSNVQARSLAVQALSGLGFEPDAAAVAAEHLLDSHGRNDPGTGLGSILALEHRLAVGGDRRRPIATLRETPTTAVVDGGGNAGYVVAHHAMRLAMDKAARHGISCVGASNTYLLGRLAYYTDMASQRGLKATCAALVQGSLLADDGRAAPALLAQMLGAMCEVQRTSAPSSDDAAFLVVVVDPRRLVTRVDLPGTPHPLTEAYARVPVENPLPASIDIPDQLHRSLLKLGKGNPAIAA